MLNSPAWAMLSLNRALHQRAHLFENTKSEHDDLCPTNTTKRREKNVTTTLLLLEKVRKQQPECVHVHAWKDSPETPATKRAKLCPQNEMLRANWISSMLGNRTLAKLKFMLLTTGRADIALVMSRVNLAQPTKLQAQEEAV